MTSIWIERIASEVNIYSLFWISEENILFWECEIFILDIKNEFFLDMSKIITISTIIIGYSKKTMYNVMNT